MSYMKRLLEEGIPVKVYLNRNERESFMYGWSPGHPLELAAEYQSPYGDEIDGIENAPGIAGILNQTFRELNIDFPETDWGKDYRHRGMRSLSVGDVVVIGELAYACERVGWKCVSLQAEDVL
jgi:hypothetical protein